MNKENLALATELRHRLHAHPELSYQEVWTKKTLMEFLQAHTSLELFDRGKYFYAVCRSKAAEKRPAVAYRADFDALPILDDIDAPYRSQFPGIGHKCGHDGHAASLCAFALELGEMDLDRDVYLVFQHAEETGQGGIEAKDFLYENPDIAEIYAYHNEAQVELGKIQVWKETSNCASKGMTIHMKGTPTHASLPENGKNPVFALANVVSAVPALIEPSRWKGIVLCTIVQMDVGAYAFGTAAGEGLLRMTIRGQYEEEMDALQVALEEIARAEAEKAGVTVDFRFEDVFPETRNDAAHVEKVMQAAETLGFKAERMEIPTRGSEDFGHFLKVVPGAYFVIGNGADGAAIHTVGFDFNDAVIEYGVEMFKQLARM